MELFAVCITCSQTKGIPLLNQFSASFFDDQIARVKCVYGHDMAIIVRAPKFEILLESGANALNSGFTLEASASFSAALERFFEFATKVISKHLDMSGDVYDTMFKFMSRQSERQIGAFFMLYALAFEKAYEPNKKLIEFRNSVIHKGTIPTPEKADQFCALVYSEIYKTSELLVDKCKKEIEMVLAEDFEERVGKIKGDVRIHGAQKSSVFSILGDNNKCTFQEAIKNFNHFNKTLEKAAKDMPILQNIINNHPEIQKVINRIR